MLLYSAYCLFKDTAGCLGYGSYKGNDELLHRLVTNT